MAPRAAAQYRRALARLRRTTWRVRMPPPWLLAAAGYFLVFAAVTWPLTPRFTHATYGGPGDGWALIWQTRFRFEHGVSYFSPTYSTDIGWPVGANLTSSLFCSTPLVKWPKWFSSPSASAASPATTSSF